MKKIKKLCALSLFIGVSAANLYGNNELLVNKKCHATESGMGTLVFLDTTTVQRISSFGGAPIYVYSIAGDELVLQLFHGVQEKYKIESKDGRIYLKHQENNFPTDYDCE